MPTDFPASPAIGTPFTQASGVTYVWDGVKWTNGVCGGGGTGGGSPAPPDRAVQFNNAGAFGGSLNLVYSATGDLGIGTSNPEVSVHANGGILSMNTPVTWPDIGPGIMMYCDPSNSGANGSAIYSYNFGPNTAIDLNIYAHNLIGNVTTSAFSGRMGIGKNPGTNYALDVNGNVTASGCYYILNVPWACLDSNGTSIDLQNIAKINGSAATSFSQTPWLQVINGAQYVLQNAGGVGIGPGTYPATGMLNVTSPIANYPIYAKSTNTAALGGMQGVNDLGHRISVGMGGSAFYPAAAIDKGYIVAYDTAMLLSTGATGTPYIYLAASPNNYVGIFKTSPAYALDVTGDVNSTGCYRINGNSFACSSGGSGIALSNVTTINGSAPSGGLWSQGSGGAIYYNGGNVGIGTATPQMALDVNGSGVFRQMTTATSGEYVRVAYDSVNHAGDIFSYNSSTSLTMPLSIHGNTINLLGGNVGIGTTSPTAPLSITPATGLRLSIYDNPANIFGFGIQASLLQIIVPASTMRTGIGYGTSASFTETLSVVGGNVGIGTTAPADKLSIVTGTDSNPPSTGNTPPASAALRIGGGSSSILEMGMGASGSAWMQVTDYTGYTYHYPLVMQPNGGNVGIRTTTPTTSLCVTLGTSGGITTVPSPGNPGTAIFGNDLPSYGVNIGAISSGAGYIQSQRDDGSATVYPLYIQPYGGNIGVGTTSPNSNFNVYGTMTIGVGYAGNVGDFGIARANAPSTGVINFGSSASAYLYFDGGQFIFTNGLNISGNCVTSGNYYIGSSPIAAIITMSNVTGSRALSTVYQNSSGRPMWVSVTVGLYGSSGGSATARADGGNPPSTIVADFGQAVSASANQIIATLSFWVLPGHFYQVFAASLSYWVEYT